jgi:dTDP-4-amino-4,6-dideoxygalactose transaminase
MSGYEQQFVAEAFESNWIAPLGPNVDAFEQQLADYIQVKAVTALNSGTAALHLALIEAGVKKDDVVLCQSLTFAASAFPITYLGAEPVFIDSELTTWNMDPVLLENALQELTIQGRRVAAIVVVHLYGMPAQMDSLLSIATKYNVPVVEDAAEALGASYKGRRCGSLGDLSVLSFNGNKIITTSGGGALLSNNKALADHAKFLSTQAKDPLPYYQHSETGFNYRMSNVTAGIGRGQMLVIDDRVRARRAHFALYEEVLKELPGIQFQPEAEGSFSNRWLTTFTIDPVVAAHVPVEKIRLHLESLNIWKPMHAQPVFAHCKAYLNGNADFLFENGLCLPSGSALQPQEIQQICTLIKSVMNG